MSATKAGKVQRLPDSKNSCLGTGSRAVAVEARRYPSDQILCVGKIESHEDGF
jgi:hypothetical protein